VLPVAAIYGANASGKSNILAALRFFRKVIETSQAYWRSDELIPIDKFRLDPIYADKTSSFEGDFFIDNLVYNYGFECSQTNIVHEWLLTRRDSGDTIIFERVSGKELVFAKELEQSKELFSRVMRDNSLLLSAASVVNEKKMISLSSNICNDIRYDEIGFKYAFDVEMLSLERDIYDFIVSLLKMADRSINNLHTVKDTPGIMRADGTVIHQEPLASEDTSADVSIYGVPIFMGLSSVKNGESLRFRRRNSEGQPVDFEPREESAGTLRSYELAGKIFFCLHYGHLFCIDELEKSLHPHIARSLVQIFADRNINKKGARLLFTTHDTNLLSHELLRRDEVWFTEKDGRGATHLYPLTDIAVPKGADLEKGYLEGRFGAIPYTGDLSRLFGKE
jgi:AAA15 family ATPase/GTPase